MHKPKKNYWYILVLTETGPAFVTGMEGSMAYWEKDKVPVEYGRQIAEETAWALRLNGHVAYAVSITHELGSQPYLYDMGEFKWIWNEKAVATGRYKNQED